MQIELIEGAKNTFTVVSYLDQAVDLDSSSKILNVSGQKLNLADLTKRICSHPEVMVDGCVFVFNSKEYDFQWEFFNSDGSMAAMCGNAARAVSLWFVLNHGELKKELLFQTPSQLVNAKVLSVDKNTGQVSVVLKKAKHLFSIGNFEIYDTGVPHLCLNLFENETEAKNHSFEDIKKNEDFKEKARSLRYPKPLDLNGANVTFVWPLGLENKIKAISFERGVENWTQACGTGAIAAAYYAKKKWHLNFPIQVQMPGGLLEIDEKTGGTQLTGPASVYKKLDIEV